MYLAGFIVAGFLVAAAYAWGWLKGRRGRYERIALAVPLTVAALAAPVQIVVGDWIARRVAEDQPTKLAALEGLGPTTRGAAIHVLGWYEDGEVRYGIKIPKLLSLLAEHDPNATIRGLEAVAPEDRPPVNIVRIAFQTMVGIGTFLAALGVLHLVTWFRRRRFVEARWFHWAVVAAGPLSVVALIAGWVATEVGRQPWVVYGVMRTSEAVTGRRRSACRLRDAGRRIRGTGRCGRVDPAPPRATPARAAARATADPRDPWRSLRFPPS